MKKKIKKTSTKLVYASEFEIKTIIQKQLEVGQVHGKISSLAKEAENALKQITDFKKITFFSSEKKSFQFLSDYYQKKDPKKKIIYIGFPQKISRPNFSYIYQLRGAKAFLSEKVKHVAVLIVDPLFLIQNSVDFVQRIESLRTICSGSGIPFLLDERRTIARLHQKGLNFIFQFNADALLLGENLSHGISFGALASSPDFFDVNFLPGTFAPKAESLIACNNIAKELIQRKSRFYTDWNAQSNAFCRSINQKLKDDFPGKFINNFGSIFWLNNFGCNRAQKKLIEGNILKGPESCFYLPPDLSEEERKEIENKIVNLLSAKRKSAA